MSADANKKRCCDCDNIFVATSKREPFRLLNGDVVDSGDFCNLCYLAIQQRIRDGHSVSFGADGSTMISL